MRLMTSDFNCVRVVPSLKGHQGPEDSLNRPHQRACEHYGSSKGIQNGGRFHLAYQSQCQ